MRMFFLKRRFRHQPLEKRNADPDLGGHQLSITRCTKKETIANSPRIKTFQLMNIWSTVQQQHGPFESTARQGCSKKKTGFPLKIIKNHRSVLIVVIVFREYQQHYLREAVGPEKTYGVGWKEPSWSILVELLTSCLHFLTQNQTKLVLIWPPTVDSVNSSILRKLGKIDGIMAANENSQA